MAQDNSNLPSTAVGGAAAPAIAPSQTDGQITLGAEQRGITEQYITFNVGDEEYGVDIMAVREIRAWTGTTRLPNQPGYMRGVINLRGIVIPIFDLRARFGTGHTEESPTHVIIIVAIGHRTAGMLVDAVSDIMTIAQDDVQPVPMMDRMADGSFLDGLVNYNDRMVALLAVERLFDLDEIDTGEDNAAGLFE